MVRMAKRTPDITEPPNIAVRFRFWAEKWDHEYARNALLHYIASKKLAKDCEKWFEKHWPEEPKECKK